MRRREHDVVHRRTDQADGELVDLRFQLLVARGIALARLGEDDHALGAARRIGRAEHRHAAAAHSGEVAHPFLELVGADVAPAADDDVLLAAGDVEAAFRHVSAVAGVDPFAVEQRLRRLRISVVAGGGRGTAELQLPLAAVRKLETRRVDHAQVVIRNHRAARHDFQRRGVRRWCIERFAGGGKTFAVERIHSPLLAGRGEGEAHGGFRQSIDRRHDVRAEAIFRETALELRHRIRAYRLGAVEGEAPGR